MAIFKLKSSTVTIISICVLTAIILCSIFVVNFYPAVRPVGGFSNIPICSVDSDVKRVAVTFDCVTFNDDVDRIIKVLNECQVKGTFFVTGEKVKDNKDLLVKINNMGHDIGNMTYSYGSLGDASTNVIKNEIQECNAVIKEVTGVVCNLFRAPYDDYGKNTVKIAGNMGMYSVRYDVDALSWKVEMSKDIIIDRIINNTKPGSIIVFRTDGYYTTDILFETISRLKMQGYEFLPVSEMIIRNNFIIDYKGVQAASSN